MIEPLSLEHVKEAKIDFDPQSRTYNYADPEEKGLPPYERCIEIPWVLDRVGQVFDGRRRPGFRHGLLDFGCNKAQYLAQLKQKHGLKTYGIDILPQAKGFVDKFYCGEFNRKMARRVSGRGPYDVCTAISSIEHAGYRRQPDITWVTEYQTEILRFLIDVGKYIFISVPYGKRPGWPVDMSRVNFHQFDASLIQAVEDYAHYQGKESMVEVYRYDSGLWSRSDLASAADCVYRGNKGGASAIALISIWGV